VGRDDRFALGRGDGENIREWMLVTAISRVIMVGGQLLAHFFAQIRNLQSAPLMGVDLTIVFPIGRAGRISRGFGLGRAALPRPATWSRAVEDAARKSSPPSMVAK